MKYNNDQIDRNLDEIAAICKQVSNNGHGIKLTVTPLSDGIMTVNKLTSVLDIGDEYSFFYSNQKDAITDQVKLCTYLRVRGVLVAKVVKNEPLTIKE